MRAADGQVVVVVNSRRWLADAGLIAAAPEPLEALRNLLDMHGTERERAAHDRARALLSKLGIEK